ncbi:HAD family hydrolase [Streptomyces sp. NPDC051132]|uniref:HAD family hydrolase n=1 Tax=unclassified Streptomyces TaxID=2593676 RepID=UPI00343F5C6E
MNRAVIFDVGECLVDETTEYGTWADWLGVPRHTFAAMFAPDVDLVGTSDDWGTSKPDRAFFDRVAEVVPAGPDEMLYVGDRVDNDIRPAAMAGMHTALVRRGPWATIQWNSEEAKKFPTFRVESLLELSGLIRSFNVSQR